MHANLNSQPIFRFAPSPNGPLHLGHAFSALLTAKWANEMSGQFLLRIEDIDHQRCKPEITATQLQDLHWLGLSFKEPILYQSSRREAYSAAADDLRAQNLLYPCFCSRKDVQSRATQTDPDGAPLYPGSCKNLSKAQIDNKFLAGEKAQWRLHMAEALDRTGILTFSQSQPTPSDRPQIKYARPQLWGDAVIVRKDIGTSYHLAVVLDDDFQNITHVTRGKDMQAATDLHVLLQFLLGLKSPNYTFHKLIVGDDGKKLAKSRNSAGQSATSLSALRQDGYTAHDLRETLGF